MNRRILGVMLGILFVGLMATPVVLKRVSARHTPIAVDAPRDAVMARYGFCFQEVAKAAGMEFTHQAA